MATDKKALSGLPESVPIGPIPFDIVPMPDRAQVAGEESWGNIDYEDGSIEIWPDLSKYHQIVTLFHEIMHGALDRSGLCHVITEEQSELLCTLVGYAFGDLIECGWLKFGGGQASQKPVPTAR